MRLLRSKPWRKTRASGLSPFGPSHAECFPLLLRLLWGSRPWRSLKFLSTPTWKKNYLRLETALYDIGLCDGFNWRQVETAAAQMRVFLGNGKRQLCAWASNIDHLLVLREVELWSQGPEANCLQVAHSVDELSQLLRWLIVLIKHVLVIFGVVLPCTCPQGFVQRSPHLVHAAASELQAASQISWFTLVQEMICISRVWIQSSFEHSLSFEEAQPDQGIQKIVNLPVIAQQIQLFFYLSRPCAFGPSYNGEDVQFHRSQKDLGRHEPKAHLHYVFDWRTVLNTHL